MSLQFSNMSIQDKSASQLEIQNAYLIQQNEHLTKELSFTRYTIQALKSMTTQRDTVLTETRLELERALHHIQLLSSTLQRQQQQQNGLSGIGPQLMQDDLSDDQELSEDEMMYEDNPRPSLDIMSKLPLRHPHHHGNQIFVNEVNY
ncbi:hypothetical protein INT47_012341 [Mucor saturninus]|uniref:Uncharacterized protein n=1 Tax=Mucor saturninus TaxID=64648 RepID=A0A8H7UYL2_9FUNG|nr:hypothetical protein INT47_012341 [Mucor saturninus]